MTVKVLGNHSKGFLGHGIGGQGVPNIPVGTGWWSASASQAGDVAHVQLGSIMTSDINQGIFFQSEAGGTAEFTLCNPGMATSDDPLINAAVLWGNSLPIPAGGEIVHALLIFTVVKITFTAPGTIYIGAA